MLKDSEDGLYSELLSLGTFPSSDVKTKAKRLKLLRFESGFWFRLKVKIRGGGWGVINLISWVSNTGPIGSVFEISSLKGIQLIRFITPQPLLPPHFYLKTKSEPDFETQ